ncbi:MAG: hypothetical protein ACR2NA_02210 [Solirubrobacterales bacterium]
MRRSAAVVFAVGGCLLAAGCTSTNNDEVRASARAYAGAIVTRNPSRICEYSSPAFRERVIRRRAPADAGKDTACKDAWKTRLKAEGRKLGKEYADFHILGVEILDGREAKVLGESAERETLDMDLVLADDKWVVDSTSISPGP